MTRDEWLHQFEDEIVKLRPHLAGSKMAYTLALQKYNPKAHPRELAREYDKALKHPPPAPTKKRTK